MGTQRREQYRQKAKSMVMPSGIKVRVGFRNNKTTLNLNTAPENHIYLGVLKSNSNDPNNRKKCERHYKVVVGTINATAGEYGYKLYVAKSQSKAKNRSKSKNKPFDPFQSLENEEVWRCLGDLKNSNEKTTPVYSGYLLGGTFLLESQDYIYHLTPYSKDPEKARHPHLCKKLIITRQKSTENDTKQFLVPDTGAWHKAKDHIDADGNRKFNTQSLKSSNEKTHAAEIFASQRTAFSFSVGSSKQQETVQHAEETLTHQGTGGSQGVNLSSSSTAASSSNHGRKLRSNSEPDKPKAKASTNNMSNSNRRSLGNSNSSQNSSYQSAMMSSSTSREQINKKAATARNPRPKQRSLLIKSFSEVIDKKEKKKIPPFLREPTPPFTIGEYEERLQKIYQALSFITKQLHKAPTFTSAGRQIYLKILLKVIERAQKELANIYQALKAEEVLFSLDNDNMNDQGSSKKIGQDAVKLSQSVAKKINKAPVIVNSIPPQQKAGKIIEKKPNTEADYLCHNFKCNDIEYERKLDTKQQRLVYSIKSEQQSTKDPQQLTAAEKSIVYGIENATRNMSLDSIPIVIHSGTKADIILAALSLQAFATAEKLVILQQDGLIIEDKRPGREETCNYRIDDLLSLPKQKHHKKKYAQIVQLATSMDATYEGNVAKSVANSMGLIGDTEQQDSGLINSSTNQLIMGHHRNQM